jgi:hypothetical protein
MGAQGRPQGIRVEMPRRGHAGRGEEGFEHRDRFVESAGQDMHRRQVLEAEGGQYGVVVATLELHTPFCGPDGLGRPVEGGIHPTEGAVYTGIGRMAQDPLLEHPQRDLGLDPCAVGFPKTEIRGAPEPRHRCVPRL